jgi:hypothetical protein
MNSENFNVVFPERNEFVSIVERALMMAKHPMKPRELALIVWKEWGVQGKYIDGKYKNLQNLEERIRTAAICSGKLGYGGLGRNSQAYVFMRWWFADAGLFNDQPEPIAIEVTREIRDLAMRDAERRARFLQAGSRGVGRHLSDVVSGFICQYAVRCYMEERWPTIVLPPSNEHDFKRPAPDDLRVVKISKRKQILVDVTSTAKTTGVFGPVVKEVNGRSAHFHVLTSPVRSMRNEIVRVLIHGWVSRGELEKGVYACDARNFTSLEVRLNCIVADVDYHEMRRVDDLAQAQRNAELVQSGRKLPTHQSKKKNKKPTGPLAMMWD